MGKGKSKKKDKKKIDIDKLLTIVIITVLSVLLSFSYCHKKVMLKDTKTTTCIVVDRRKKPGTSFTGYLAKVEYYVNDKLYTTEVPHSSDDYIIGEKFRIKYSIKDPTICEVLWNEKVLGEEAYEEKEDKQ